jgi:hypothetical protein
MRTVGTIFIGGLIFVGAFVGAQAFFFAGRTQSPEEVQAQLDKEVVALKKNLPQQVDSRVTWFDVETKDRKLIYKDQVAAPRGLVMSKQKELEDQLKQSTMIGLGRMMLPQGVKLRFELYDEEKSYMFSIDLD